MRKLEVVEATRKASRLTITPTRITVKVLPVEIDYKEIYIEAAERIAENVDYPYSLRGRLKKNLDEVRLQSGSDTLIYDFKGNLLQSRLNKGKNNENLNS